MARVTIDLPDKYVFSHVMEVRIYDINHGQHLGHDRLISLMHEARNQFFHSLGYEELDIEGTGIVVADLAVVYEGEVFVGDTLQIDLAVANFAEKSMEMFYRVVEAGTEKSVAKAKTGIVFFDYTDRKTAPIPLAFLEHFKAE